ncbi:MAG: sugar ABC transporter ATP-binding protein [Brevinema sp.]
MKDLILYMQNIDKSFGNNHVLKKVKLHIYRGRIMALMGENGAGKSTLIKILSGLEKAQNGCMFFENKEYIPKNIDHAESLGIVIIHQELNLFPDMTILDNVFLGTELGKPLYIDDITQEKILKELMNTIGLDLSPKTYIRDLSVGQQQLIEIIKALHKKAKILVMDEPTSALSQEEIQKVFEVIRLLKNQGTSIVYISHRMQEIFEICDDVTILRDGEFIEEFDLKYINEQDLIQAMVGRNIDNPFPYEPAELRGDYLRVVNLSGDYVQNISFNLQRGEILGISGLMGAGRTSLMHMLYGLLPIHQGNIYIKDSKISINHPSDALAHSIIYVSEDRKGDGLFLDFSIAYNVGIASLDLFSGVLGHIDSSQEMALVRDFSQLTSVKNTSLLVPVSSLSGGNQQKVALSRALLTAPMVLILDEPTRGIDIGARREIYLMINQFKKEGTAIILISSDMPEVLGLSDRILVMSEGRSKGILDFDEKSPENIMKLIVS